MYNSPKVRVSINGPLHYIGVQDQDIHSLPLSLPPIYWTTSCHSPTKLLHQRCKINCSKSHILAYMQIMFYFICKTHKPLNVKPWLFSTNFMQCLITQMVKNQIAAAEFGSLTSIFPCFTNTDLFPRPSELWKLFERKKKKEYDINKWKNRRIY